MKIPGKHLGLKNFIRNFDTEDKLHLDGSQPISTLLFLLFQFFVVLSFIFDQELLEKHSASRKYYHICKIYGHNHQYWFENFQESW